MVKNELCIQEGGTLQEAIEHLHKGGYGVLCVLSKRGKMIGLLTDGDFRKAILNHLDLKSPLTLAMNKKFTYYPHGGSRENAVKHLKKIQRRHLPILDSKGFLKDIVLLDEIEFRGEDNLVVLMAGGLGTRLAPLTKNCPKPLVQIGGKPILEHILQNFIAYGFRRFVISVNYMGDMIKTYFKDGAKWGASIDYIFEQKKLGTAGALSLLRFTPKESIVVCNGDVMTKLNLKSLMEFHAEHKFAATIAVQKYGLQVPYGVIEHRGHEIIGITEKPTHEFYVNAGIYVLEPECLNYIPHNHFFDMPDLFVRLIGDGKHPAAFPVLEHWIDVGKVADLEQARKKYKTGRNRQGD